MVSLTRVIVLAIAAAAMGVEAGKVGKAIKGVVSTVLKRRGQNSIWERSDESLNELTKEYPECMQALKAKPHLDVKVDASQTLTVDGMPEPCMANIKAHNAKAEHEKAKEEGTATVTGPNSVVLKGVAEDVVAFFQGLDKTA